MNTMSIMLVFCFIALQSPTISGFASSGSSFPALTSTIRRVQIKTASADWNNKLFRRADSHLASTQMSDELDEPLFSARRLSYLSLWTGLLGYTTYFTNTMTPEATAAGPAILNSAIFTPFDGTLSPIFITLFFFLGILPCVYGSLLLPASKNQKVWALPFVASSFALGFFGIGPYLGLRNRAPSPEILTTSDRDTGAILFDNKITPVFLLGSAIYLIYYALTGEFSGGDRWEGYTDLFNTQPLARISTIDFTILSLAVSLLTANNL